MVRAADVQAPMAMPAPRLKRQGISDPVRAKRGQGARQEFLSRKAR